MEKKRQGKRGEGFPTPRAAKMSLEEWLPKYRAWLGKVQPGLLEALEEGRRRNLAEYFESPRLDLERGAYHAGWDSALWDAILWCEEFFAPYPAWVRNALEQKAREELGMTARRRRKGRAANWRAKMDQELTDFRRAHMVRELREQGQSAKAAVIETAERLGVSPGAVKDSCRRMKKDVFSLKGKDLWRLFYPAQCVLMHHDDYGHARDSVVPGILHIQG